MLEQRVARQQLYDTLAVPVAYLIGRLSYKQLLSHCQTVQQLLFFW
jgi:hypothetical protein